MRGYCGIGLFNPKNKNNVGSVLRAAGCFDAAFVAITGKRYRKAVTDTMKAHRRLPLFHLEDLKTIIPYDCIPVAVECCPEAQTLESYQHPERAFYIFGPEDGTLGSNITDWCRDVVQIETNRCLNLAACVNVVLYDRQTKRKLGNEESIND